MAQNGNFPILNLFGGQFVSMTMVSVELMPDFYTWVILLTNQSEEIGEKQISVLAPEGAKLTPKCTYLFGEILSISSKDIELKRNYDGQTDGRQE